MVIDIFIIVNGQSMTVRSEAASYNKTKPVTIGLSKGYSEDAELIEAVGEPWTTADLKHLAIKKRGRDNRIYRVINPFSVESFEAGGAFRIVQFYCYQVHERIRPKTFLLRRLFGFDKYDITLKLPGYNSVPPDKRKEFETELRRISRRIKIER